MCLTWLDMYSFFHALIEAPALLIAINTGVKSIFVIDEPFFGIW